jgi:hypothetical protein
MKICTQCNNTGYIEIKRVYPISFLPNIGYVKKEKKLCEDCSYGIEARRQESKGQLKEGNTGARANGLAK